MDIIASNDSRFVSGVLPSDSCYSEQRFAVSVWTLIGDDVRIDWSRSVVKDAVFLSCMNQYDLIQPTNSRLIESSLREN